MANRFLRWIEVLKPYHLLVVMLGLLFFDKVTACSVFLLHPTLFARLETNEALKSALIQGDLTSEIVIDVLLITLFLIVTCILLKPKGLTKKIARRSIGITFVVVGLSLILIWGFSMAVATNIVGGILLLYTGFSFYIGSYLVGVPIAVLATRYGARIANFRTLGLITLIMIPHSLAVIGFF